MTSPGLSKVWAWLWVLQLQFFVAYEVVLFGWKVPYDWRRFAISDLEASECYSNPDDGRWVCSPWHTLMSVSFILTGALIVAGALLAPRALFGKAAAALFVLGGIGFVVVGLTPDLAAGTWHKNAAVLGILAGNLGVLVAGLRSRRQLRPTGAVAALIGVVGLVGFVMTLVNQIVWVAPHGPEADWAMSWFGGVERVAVYSVIIGLIVLGAGALLVRTPRDHKIGDQAPAEQENRRDDARDDDEAGRDALSDKLA